MSDTSELAFLFKALKAPAAAQAFEKLEVYAGHEELVQFKIVVAYLLAGNLDAAKPVLDAMKFPGDTPAYYFAHSAWAYANKDKKGTFYWSNAGLEIFHLIKCLPFYDALASIGWLPMRTTDGQVPEQTDLTALPAASPAAVLPGATP